MTTNNDPLPRFRPKSIRWKTSHFPECEAWIPYDEIAKSEHFGGWLLPFASHSECELECARLNKREAQP